MILTCPSCATRYVVDPRSVGAAGRRVRCVKCQHSWHEPPPPPEAMTAAAATATPPPAEGGPADRATPAGRRSDGGSAAADPAGPAAAAGTEDSGSRIVNLPALPGRPEVGRAWIGWVLVLLLAAGVVVAGTLFRDAVVEAFPAAARLYRAAGIPVTDPDQPGAGLEIRDVATARRFADGHEVLEVVGRVVNATDVARPLPPLALVFRAGDGSAASRHSHLPDDAELAPGGSWDFALTVPPPGADATTLTVGFADPSAPAGG